MQMGQTGEGHQGRNAADVHQRCNRLCQWWSAGGNIPGCDFGLYRTKPGAKDRQKFARLCRGALTDRLEIVCVKNRPRTGSLLVQCKNPR